MLPNKSIQNISTVYKLDWYQFIVARSRSVIIQIEIMSSHVQETKMPKPKILQKKETYYMQMSNNVSFQRFCNTYTVVGFIQISWCLNSIHRSFTILKQQYISSTFSIKFSLGSSSTNDRRTDKIGCGQVCLFSKQNIFSVPEDVL